MKILMRGTHSSSSNLLRNLTHVQLLLPLSEPSVACLTALASDCVPGGPYDVILRSILASQVWEPQLWEAKPGISSLHLSYSSCLPFPRARDVLRLISEPTWRRMQDVTALPLPGYHQNVEISSMLAPISSGPWEGTQWPL